MGNDSREKEKSWWDLKWDFKCLWCLSLLYCTLNASYLSSDSQTRWNKPISFYINFLFRNRFQRKAILIISIFKEIAFFFACEWKIGSDALPWIDSKNCRTWCDIGVIQLQFQGHQHTFFICFAATIIYSSVFAGAIAIAGKKLIHFRCWRFIVSYLHPPYFPNALFTVIIHTLRSKFMCRVFFVVVVVTMKIFNDLTLFRKVKTRESEEEISKSSIV